jgi:hypothetical protein
MPQKIAHRSPTLANAAPRSLGTPQEPNFTLGSIDLQRTSIKG